MKRIATMLVATLGLSLAACNDNEAPAPTIVMSADVTTVALNEEFGLGWLVTDFNLKPHDDSDDPMALRDYGGAREGHAHLYAGSFETEPLIMTHETDIRFIFRDDATHENDPGVKTLLVRLHDLEHKIIEPQIYDSIEITVTAE